VSRRSPNNERYQKFTGPKGQTRKSAAAAKPSRKEGSSSSSAKSKTKGKTKLTGERAPGGKYYEPDTPEYKYWRKLWWIALVVGLVLVAISFYFQYYLKQYEWARPAGVVTIVLSYAAIIAAFLIDYRKLRPMRTGKYVYKTEPKPVAEKPADKPSDAGDSGDKS
jgi:hypothetical protein